MSNYSVLFIFEFSLVCIFSFERSSFWTGTDDVTVENWNKFDIIPSRVGW